MKRHARWLLVAVGAALVVGAGALVWHLRARQNTWFTDADTIRFSADQVAPRDVVWQPPVALAPPVNSADDEQGAAPSADGTELYFARGRAGGGADLFVITRRADGWSAPEPVAGVNTPADELRPSLSPDGQSLYFTSDRAGGHGGYDLWVARRGPGGWRPPENLGPDVNSRYDDYSPSVAPDGRTLFFASNRPGPDERAALADDAWASQVADDARGRDFDLYVATASGAGHEPAVFLDVLNSAHEETAPAASPVGDFLYFASNRPGGAGGFDLYRARVAGGVIMEPEALGAPVCTAGNELDPVLSLGGFALHYAGDSRAEGGDHYDLYYTTSREVFTLTETWRAQFDFASLWAMIWPWLLLTLLGVLALMGLSQLFGRLEYRKLGLLVRCLMVSLIAHMVLMVVLAFWAVHIGPEAWLRPATGMKVALTSPSVGTGITRQLRGELASPEMTSAIRASARSEYENAPGERFEAATRSRVERAPLEVPMASAVTVETRESMPAGTSAPAARHLEPESAASEVQVRLPATRTFETAPEASPEQEVASRVATGREAPRPADSGEVVPAPAVATAAVPMTPGAAPAAAGEQGMAPLPAHDAAAPASAVLHGADDAAARDLGGDVELELADLPERPAGEPAAEQGVLGSAHLGASAMAAGVIVPVDVPAAAAPVAVAPDAPVGGAAETTLFQPAERDAGAPSASFAARPSDAAAGLTELPPLEVAQLPEYHRTQLGTPADDERTGLTSATAPADVAAAVATGSAESALAPAATSPAAAPSSFAHAAAVDAATGPVPAELGDELGAIGPDPLHLTFAPLEEGASRAARELHAPVADARPGAPQAEFESPEDSAPSLAPPLAVASAAGAADVLPLPEAPVFEATPESDMLDALPAAVVAMAPMDLDLNLPAQVAPTPYPQRNPATRLEVAKRMGGNEKTEEAVALALDWLARHQSPDGRWDGTNYDDRCGACEGRQQVKCDIALTGLALLCFQGAGHTHKTSGPYRAVIRRGIEWLLGQQHASGALMVDESMYSHGIATIALSEAYGMTGDPSLETPVRAAADFIFAARHKPRGGWRYTPGQYGDTSVLGWQIMALTSARRADIEVPDEAFDVARAWLGAVSHRSSPGRYRYQPDRNVTPAMTAEGMFVQQLLGARAEERNQVGSAEYILLHPPNWDVDPNTYYWYYATLALFQHQGEAWRRWNEAVKSELLANQVTDGSAAGSWNPEDRWSQVAGRVYQTAMCTLTLEVYYRYLPSFVTEGK